MTTSDELLRRAINEHKKGKSVSQLNLWVRAGSDGLRNGGDPLCQHIFMVMLRKSTGREDDKSVQFNVKTVNPNKPHVEFRDAGLRLVPAVQFNEDVYEHPDEIIEFLDTRFPQPTLQYFDPDADDATTDVFSKFCWFIKEVNKDPKALEHELQRIDAHLMENGTKFLTGSNLTHLDCRIMPVLHHIRIAGGALKAYEIPKRLAHLWKYLKNTYECDIFRKSVASDQEIVLHWAERKDTPNLTPARATELTRQEPEFTMSV